MSTDLINKIDLKTFIGDLEKEEKPKTLEEIRAEVGFPFTARAVLGAEAPAWPTGIELSFSGGFDNQGAYVADRPHPDNNFIIAVRPYLPRWQLLGHKT